MESIVTDIRYALRSLARTPVFAVVAILTLAIGIGANGAIFSVIRGVILKPLGYHDPGQLVLVTSQFPGMGFDKFWVSGPEYVELRQRAHSFANVGAFVQRDLSLAGRDQPMRVRGAFVSATLLDLLGVGAQLGRTIGVEEDRPNAEPVAVLSHELWQRSFGADRSLIGTRIEVQGEPRTVIGVMPPGFDVDDNGVELWLPLGLDPADPGGRARHYLYLVGRLADNTSIDQARAELGVLLEGWDQASGGGHVPRPNDHPLQIEPLRDQLIGDTRPALYTLFGAVGFVLLIACANVANLLLARSETRHKEIAIRTAMGAGRLRLFRQLLTESVVLATLGAGLGLALAQWGLSALLAANPDSLPRSREVGLDWTVLFFTLGVAVLTGLLFGLAPALHARLGRLSGVLKEGGTRATASGARTLLRRSLVVTEIALAVVLVVGSGLMIRSFWNLLHIDAGFASAGRVTFETYLPAAKYPTDSEIGAFYERLLERLGAVPGVESAAAMSGLPPLRRLNANDTEFEGLVRTEDGPPHNIDYYQTVTAGYFESLGVGIAEGRGFETTDDAAATPVALINEQAAKVFYPGESPIGRRLRPCCGDELPWLSVVGVARDVKQGGIDQAVGTELYLHLPQAVAVEFAPRTMNVVVTSALGVAETMSALRREVWALDPTLPLARLRPMSEVVTDSLARPRFLTLLLLVFGAIALTLAAVGTYGVIAYSVAERRQEIGIRLALGAQTQTVVGLVLGQGLTLVAVGVVLGIAAALGLTRLLASLLYGTSGTDPATFVAVTVLLVVIAGLACWIPAQRAARLDPLVVLRHD